LVRVGSKLVDISFFIQNRNGQTSTLKPPTMKKLLVRTALSMVATLTLSNSLLRTEEVKCTIKLEVWGTLDQNLTSWTKIREGVCVKIDLPSIGKTPTELYYTVKCGLESRYRVVRLYL
jgi:hypothetical protein